jgi:hypothetical protein
MNENTTPETEAKALISEILTKAWPSTAVGAGAYQLAYLKGMLAAMAASCPELLYHLERHRDIVIDNNRSMH